jgi:hypothetical protein
MAISKTSKEELENVEHKLKELLTAQERGRKVLQKYEKLKNKTQKDFAKKFNRKMEIDAAQIKELEKKRLELSEELKKATEQEKKKREELRESHVTSEKTP